MSSVVFQAHCKGLADILGLIRILEYYLSLSIVTLNFKLSFLGADISHKDCFRCCVFSLFNFNECDFIWFELSIYIEVVVTPFSKSSVVVSLLEDILRNIFKGTILPYFGSVPSAWQIYP